MVRLFRNYTGYHSLPSDPCHTVRLTHFRNRFGGTNHWSRQRDGPIGMDQQTARRLRDHSARSNHAIDLPAIATAISSSSISRILCKCRCCMGTTFVSFGQFDSLNDFGRTMAAYARSLFVIGPKRVPSSFYALPNSSMSD